MGKKRKNKIKGLDFVEWTDKEIEEGTRKLNEHNEEAYQAVLKWFEDAGRKLK